MKNEDTPDFSSADAASGIEGPGSGLSVIIIAGAEEHNIRGCLDSVAFADEIIVVHSGNTDKTAEIAREFTQKVIFREFDGFATQKRAALGYATAPWVLSIDADERVTDELRAEIAKAIAQGAAYGGYYIPRKNFVRNKWLKHGGNYPDYQFRLFRREGAEVTDRLVHEKFTVPGARGYLRAPLNHYTLPEIRHMLAKNVAYALFKAQEQQHRARAGVLDFILRPPLAFFKKYVLSLGFLDGWMGFIYSIIHAMNKLQVQMYIWELQHPLKDGSERS